MRSTLRMTNDVHFPLRTACDLLSTMRAACMQARSLGAMHPANGLACPQAIRKAIPTLRTNLGRTLVHSQGLAHGPVRPRAAGQEFPRNPAARKSISPLRANASIGAGKSRNRIVIYAGSTRL